MKMYYTVAALIISLGMSANSALADKKDHAEEHQRDASADQRLHEKAVTFERRAESESRHPPLERPAQADQSKHANHLSAGERRALRQQINEAGQDIYGRQR